MEAAPEVIEKVRKLLRLARSANPHEADLALEKAMALAREHRIQIEGLSVDQAEKATATTHGSSDAFSRMSYGKRYAATIVQRFFNVSAVVGPTILVIDGWPRAGRKLNFVGTSVDVQIALYVYVFLTRRFAYCWAHHRGLMRNRRSFVHGMYWGIYSKLKEAEPPEPPHAPGLVLAERNAYIGAVFGPTENNESKSPDRLAQAAAWAGYLKGRETEIRRPLARPKEETLALA